MKNNKGLKGEPIDEIIDDEAADNSEGVDDDTQDGGASCGADDSENSDEDTESEGNEDAEKTAETTDAEDANTKYLRLAADFQNFRRRTEQEKSDIYKFANEKFATGLLEVLDNFERAIEQENQDTSIDENFLEGMKMILDQLINVLKQNNVEEIVALGQPFDPLLHHAVMTEKSDEYKPGEVTKVMQKGYILKEKVIRPSMVAVAE